MPRWKLTIEYDGRPFVGWQRQDNGPSVQATIEQAIFKLTGEHVTIGAAGRTDAGVHGCGQVAHADIARPFDAFRLQEALNAHLRPHPVAILAAEPVADTFHARFDATARHSRYYRTWFPRFARKAARIITVSGYSKQDIVARYGVPADRIDVAYNGVGDVFTPLGAAERATARQRFTGGAPYIVCVGSLHPRKNVARLLEAFDRVAGHDPEVKLLIVGARMFKDAHMERVLGAMQHRERAVFAGRLAHADLRLALGGAQLLAYVSYFEGFGIPVAEAMRCGVPVVAANATSLPEVAGDAALYCDPFDVADIARALRTMLTDEPLRQRAIAAGLERAKRYDWDRTAEIVWRTMERVMPRR